MSASLFRMYYKYSPAWTDELDARCNHLYQLAVEKEANSFRGVVYLMKCLKIMDDSSEMESKMRSYFADEVEDENNMTAEEFKQIIFRTVYEQDHAGVLSYIPSRMPASVDHVRTGDANASGAQKSGGK